MPWGGNEKRNAIGKREQLCWSCENACGKCSWSKKLIPIKGWEAENDCLMMTYSKGKRRAIYSFKIYNCPEFIGRRRKR